MTLCFALVVQARDERLDGLPQSRRTRARAGVNEADQQSARLVREQPLDLGASLLGGHHHQAERVKAAQAAIEIGGHVAQVLVDQLLDVPGVASLRPAALVVAARLLVEVVGEQIEIAARKQPYLSLLTPDGDDNDLAAAARDRHEWRQVEPSANPAGIRHRSRERQDAPERAGATAEQSQTAGAIALELLVEVAANAVEIGLEREALLVRERVALDAAATTGLGEESVEVLVELGGGRKRARVEIEVEADRASIRGSEGSQLAECVLA